MNLWDRQKGELNLWYDRFTRFRLQGPGRSLLSLYHQWQDEKGKKRAHSPAKSWRDACKKWEWRKRAEAWDKHERLRLEAEYNAEREEWRDKRRKLLQGFFGKLVQALGKLKVDDASFAQLTQAVKVIVQELRSEFDDLPTERHEVTMYDEAAFTELLNIMDSLIPDEHREAYEGRLKTLSDRMEGK